MNANRIASCFFTGIAENAWSRVSAVPCNAESQFSAVEIACHDLVLQRTILCQDSAGSRFSAVSIVWRDTAP